MAVILTWPLFIYLFIYIIHSGSIIYAKSTVCPILKTLHFPLLPAVNEISNHCQRTAHDTLA